MRVEEEVCNRILKVANHEFGQVLTQVALATPPDLKLGDFALECFSLAKLLAQSPQAIAKKIAASISADDVIAAANAEGAYVNISLRTESYLGLIVEEVNALGDTFGDSQTGDGARTMVEYLSPNTNKPLHLGHVRNGCLGMSVARILEAAGYDVITANLVNDRGVHICKSMLAWQRWGDGKTPEGIGQKGDHFVGHWYVRFAKELDANQNLEQEAQQMLQRWEAGDSDTIELWRMLNGWVYQGFEETYRRLGFSFDVFYYESDTYHLGKDLIERGLEDGVFVQDENGAIVCALPVMKKIAGKDGKLTEVIAFGAGKDGEPKKVTVLRSDGTSVYMTQDLGTAKRKFDENQLKRSIYVVGSEQDYHFQCLFEILSQLGLEWAQECYHLSYGMVYLPDGKMKSREGKVVDADDLVCVMAELAAKEIRNRDTENTIDDAEVERRAILIGNAAIKFYLLQYSPGQLIHFDPEESISFEGKTGPYCLYTYARAKSIERKASKLGQSSDMPSASGFGQMNSDDERLLALKLQTLSSQIAVAAEELNPSRVASAVYYLSRAFNQFYHKHPVINAGNPELCSARLALLRASATAIKKGLYLLGIETLEQM